VFGADGLLWVAAEAPTYLLVYRLDAGARRLELLADHPVGSLVSNGFEVQLGLCGLALLALPLYLGLLGGVMPSGVVLRWQVRGYAGQHSLVTVSEPDELFRVGELRKSVLERDKPRWNVRRKKEVEREKRKKCRSDRKKKKFMGGLLATPG
jgi:hypothetical protein